MKVYFDLKMTRMDRRGEIISIGMAGADGRTLYVEFMDYNRQTVKKDIQLSVIENLKGGSLIEEHEIDHVRYAGVGMTLRKIVQGWLLYYDKVEFWGFNVPVKWVMLCDWFGGLHKLPKNVTYMVGDIATLLKDRGEDPEEWMLYFGEFGGKSLDAAETLNTYMKSFQ